MAPSGERWLDREAGPVVRAYALTRGRSRPEGAPFDLVDVVTAPRQRASDLRRLTPEHKQLLELCQQPVVVADLASEVNLALGVVQILLSDLRQRGLVSVVRPASPVRHEESVLQSVLEGLRAL
jgi:Protein of unknown function (DUF742)